MFHFGSAECFQRSTVAVSNVESTVVKHWGHGQLRIDEVNGHFMSSAGTVDELLKMVSDGNLTAIGQTRLHMVRDLLNSDFSAERICKLLTAFNEGVVVAVLNAHVDRYPWLLNCTVLEFGSGGREEHVLGSDQDNGLFLHVSPDVDEVDEATQFIVVSLDGAGLALCKGGIMMSNADWRGDFDAWQARLTDWLLNPIETGAWQSGLILDFRAIGGAQEEILMLRDRLWRYVRAKPVVLSMLISELTDYKMPVTFYGSFITEKEGMWRGSLDVKKSALTHLTNSVRLLSLKYNFLPTNTCDRLRMLIANGHISLSHGELLLSGWEYLQRKRLEIACDCLASGASPHNYIAPAFLASEERDRFKSILQAIDKLVRLVQEGRWL